ncbi:MAG: Mov34/MPN/PAD-1 family protein, partial [Microcystis sp.]
MILITDQIYRRIFTHAESTYPEECCGLLLGKITETAAEVISIQATENNWSGNRKNRFSIAPEVLLQAQKSARENQLEIIGIYHSHPDHAAIPSEIDRQLAWSGYTYIIVSVVS